jgi:hypothetical protein
MKFKKKHLLIVSFLAILLLLNILLDIYIFEIIDFISLRDEIINN